MGSALRARMYASATGVSSLSPASYTARSVGVSGTATPAPAGDTCLKLAAAARPVAALSSAASCHALAASRKLM